MLRSRSLDLSFIRRGRKRSAIRTVSQAFFRRTTTMAAVSSASDLAAAAPSSKRSRGLADIDPKFVSNSGLSGLSELETPRGGSVRIQHRPPKHGHHHQLSGTVSSVPGALSCSPSSSAGASAAACASAAAAATSAAASAASCTKTSRFPKLDECAHFHYDVVDLGPLTIQLYEESGKFAADSDLVALQITSYGKSWIVRRSYEHFRLLDQQLHRCIYDRKFSQLPLLPDQRDAPATADDGAAKQQPPEVALRPLLSNYVNRLSAIAGNLINCAPVLNWLEVDNRGRRLFPPPPSDDADAEINTPAVAAAYAVRRYAAIASDEISFEVGDMISVIDMPPPEESMWWRGKRGFDVGFFPSECVRVIGDKVPAHLSLPAANAISVGSAASASSSASASLAANKSSSALNSAPLNTSIASSHDPSEQMPTKPVLRKHGKLISFFRSFILSRPSRRKLKQSGILKERVFGCDLGEHLLNSGREIPMVLKCCAEFIEQYGVVDGIYRLSGITSNIQKLRNAFDEDRVPALVEDEAIRQDMHAVSSLLKMYFRELPNPLCTYQLYDQFVNAVQGPDELRVVRMREVVQQLPPPHFRTLEYLTRHLSRVAEHSASTGMTAKNVAIVWAPNLLRCKELEFGGVAALQGVGVQAVVTECLVRYVDLIFSDKAPVLPQLSDPEQRHDDGASLGVAGGALKRTRPKSLAISTPTKLLSLEEARHRALQLANSQNDTQYIEVGGGPASLPPKYHTVIELPNGDGRGKRGNSLKHKKSPLGWKSLFAKPGKARSPSKRKNSSASTASTVSMPAPASAAPQRAITYVRPKLRPVKSAESLVASNRNSAAGDKSITTSPEAGASKANELAASVKEVEEDRAEMDDDDDDAAAAGAAALSGDDDHSVQDGSLSRCHNRSVSHDSYFRLLLTGASAGRADALDDERGRADEHCANEAIYAEISKPGTKSAKDGSRNAASDDDHGEEHARERAGQEFGKNLNLTAVEEPLSSGSKMSLNDLSHLDDSEMNLMSSREMLALSKKTTLNESPSRQKARPASADDSIIDDSARGQPMNAEQIDEKGNWAASNPAYELFCIQAEVHHHHHQRMARSPSPDNTDAQMPDMPSEVAMDGDSDSLVNVGTEDYGSPEVTTSDKESFTLHGNAVVNDLYENVNVAENRTLADAESSTARPPEAHSYENFADNHAYAMVRVSSGASVTYENVIDPKAADEEYEPVEPPAGALEASPVCYENVDQSPDDEHVYQQPSYENIDEPSTSGDDEQPSYENLDQPSYENPDQQRYENVGDTSASSPSKSEPIDVDSSSTYENVVLRDPKPAKAAELVNVYEDVIPPPPKTEETEEVIYHQVKVLRQSIQEVNELLRQDPSVLQLALAADDRPIPSPIKIKPALPVKTIASPGDAPESKKKSLAKDSPTVRKETKLEFVIRDINVEEPAAGPRLSLSPKRLSTDGASQAMRSETKISEKDSSSHLSLSLPSLIQSSAKTSPFRTSATPPPPSIKNHSLPPTPMYDLVPDSESVSSKRRFESEIGRDLLRERRIRNEIESSRRSEGNLVQKSVAAAVAPAPLPAPVNWRPEASKAPPAAAAAAKPVLPVKTSSPKKIGQEVKVSPTNANKRTEPPLSRPNTLETSFDYEPATQRRASSPSSSSTPLSPVSPTSEGRSNLLTPGARKTSVKELLNKFQTSTSSLNESDAKSPQRSAPTSPMKQASTPTPPSSLQPSPPNNKLLLVVEESKKMMKTDGKENIEVRLSPLAPPNSGVNETMSVEKSEPAKTGDAIEPETKELLRQKSLTINIDMSDPRTRLRIERYKEERRSFLREKYKSESFRSENKDDAIIVRLKQKAGSPTQQQQPEALANQADSPSEPGLIDEDVNVKERAAQWAAPLVVTAKSVLAAATPRTCSESAGIAAAAPRRIRDMAAMFEKESP